MLESEKSNNCPSAGSSELYGRDYFFGKSSGYPAEGYAQLRGNWEDWLSLISRIKAPPGVLIDLGSAYGYLVSAARKTGYQAFGCDISSFALRQETELNPLLAQANVHRLPFRGNCCDVVCIFDVLEHLEDPATCLQEIVRLLKEDSLIVGTTPDPIYFDRKEETHCFERPPSFWIHLLQELGMTVQFRFSVDPYNFQFVAARPDTPTCERLELLQHDYFGKMPDFIVISAPDHSSPFYAVPRFGWGPLDAGTRTLRKTPASIYLLNTGSRPIRSTFKIALSHSPDFSTLRIRLDSLVVTQIHLSSEQTEHFLEPESILIPAGGHHLFFDLFPGGPEVKISEIQLEATEGDSSELTSELPFDVQQRYRLAFEIAGLLAPRKILDVGGYLGDRDGHLATSADFLASRTEQTTVVTTDLRHCDHPAHQPCDALEQPFPSHSFELVVSLDVLEHIPEPKRRNYLEELDRVSSRWILLGAPFAAGDVEGLEALLAEQLQLDFLKEHQRYGLPKHPLVEDFFVSEKGYSIKAFPNGHLSTWGVLQLLTQHLFSIRDHRIIRVFNRLYHRHIYPTDQRMPSYRTVYLISKASLDNDQVSQLNRIVHRSAERDSSFERLSLDPGLARIFALIEPVRSTDSKALSDVQFLINERQKAIRQLRALNEEMQSMPLWKLFLKRIRKLVARRGTG